MIGAFGGGTGCGTESKVETIARLAQWRIENFGPSSTRRSDAFKLGIWNWHLSVEKSRYLYIRLYPEPGRIAKEQPPFVKFVIRVSSSGAIRRPYVSPVLEKLLRTSDDFLWPVDATFQGRFTIDVEFLDMKISPLSGGEMCSIWPNEGPIMDVANKTGLHCLTRMLEEEIYTDIIINTADGGALKAHKAVLSASSPVFESMFLHDLNEKESSTIIIKDLTLEDCTALLRSIYGTIKPEDFWRHRLSLLVAADKYGITKLRDCCEESLLEDINSGNVLERLQAAWLYQLDKLKKGCLMYLFDFGKIYDVRDEIDGFFRHADRELILEIFQQMMLVWRTS